MNFNSVVLSEISQTQRVMLSWAASMEDWEQENSQKVGRRSPGDGEGGELLFTGAELASRAMQIVLQVDGGHGHTTLQAQLRPLNSAPQNGHTNRLDVIRARSVRTQGLHQAPRPWDYPRKNTGVDCHVLLRGSSQLRGWTHVVCSSCVSRQIPHP